MTVRFESVEHSFHSGMIFGALLRGADGAFVVDKLIDDDGDFMPEISVYVDAHKYVLTVKPA